MRRPRAQPRVSTPEKNVSKGKVSHFRPSPMTRRREKKQFRLGVSALNHRASERLIPRFEFAHLRQTSQQDYSRKLSLRVPPVLAALAGHRIRHSNNVDTLRHSTNDTRCDNHHRRRGICLRPQTSRRTRCYCFVCLGRRRKKINFDRAYPL